jgi:hypothetical protein
VEYAYALFSLLILLCFDNLTSTKRDDFCVKMICSCLFN